MSEIRFILCQDDLGNYEIRYDDNVFHFLWEVAPILNEQQTIIRRDEISIKTMMSNMKKLEEENKELKAEIEQSDSISKDIVCADIQHQLLKVTDENKELKLQLEAFKDKLCELGVSDVKLYGKRYYTGLEEWLNE